LPRMHRVSDKLVVLVERECVLARERYMFDIAAASKSKH
jgi:hypothetical protein